MMRLQFTAADIEELRHQRYRHPHPRVQRKMEALYLKALGYPHHEIAKIAGVSETTVRTYFRQYQQGGMAALERFETGGSVSALSLHTTTLKEEFAIRPPATVQDAVQRIEALTGIPRKQTSVRAWLKKTALATGKSVRFHPK